MTDASSEILEPNGHHREEHNGGTKLVSLTSGLQNLSEWIAGQYDRIVV
jgi:hypothetical protein